MNASAGWLEDLERIDADLTASGRRVVRGRRADGVAVVRVGDELRMPEHEIVAHEDPERAPRIDALSRVAGAVMPLACSVAPRLRVTSNLELVRTFVDQFKNAQVFSVFPRAFEAGFRHDFGYPEDPGGWASWVATGRGFLDGFPDVTVELHDLFEVDGGWVVEHNVATGTHRGTFRGIAPTGRTVTWREVHVYRCEGGRIVRNWPTVDLRHLVRALRA